MVGNFKGNAILTGPRNQLYRRPLPPKKKQEKHRFFSLPVSSSANSRIPKSSCFEKPQIFHFLFTIFLRTILRPPPLCWQELFALPSIFSLESITHVTHTPTGPPPHPKNDPKNDLPLPDALMRPLLVAHILILTTPNLTVIAGVVHLGCSKVHCSAPQRK